VFGDTGIPILAGLDAGHGEENRTIPLGCKALMDADLQCIEFETPSTVS
jgi:muramoyltetrapeptide carboxypeptidase LdcA involved in peptidoglycan recycling